jgi:hypothetical protein
MKRVLACVLLTACVAEPGDITDTSEQALIGDDWAYGDITRPRGDDTKIFFDAAFSSTGRLYIVGSTNTEWVFRTSTNGGSTFSNGPSFSYPNAHLSFAQKVAVDASGRILVVGSAAEGNEQEHVLARLSTDQGATFTTVDDIEFPGIGTHHITSLTVDSTGHFTYVISDDESRIRRSRPGGTIWMDLEVPTGARVRATCETSAGIVATGSSATSPRTALTFRRANNAWTQIDTWSSVSTAESRGHSCLETGGALYVGGERNGNWSIRRSANGGTSWAIVDTVGVIDPGYLDVFELGAGRNGRVYAVGEIDGEWVVRRTANGTTWYYSDRVDPNAASSKAYGYAFDAASGYVVAVGSGDPGTHVRRLLP